MSIPPAEAIINLSSIPSVRQHPEGSDALAELLDTCSSPEVADEWVERARRSVAQLVSCPVDEVILTSGGVESSNAALKGLALGLLSRGRTGRVVLSAVEDPAVLHPARSLARLGFTPVLVPPDRRGHIDPERFVQALERGAVLAALQLANDELGTVQAVDPVASRAAELEVPLHVDATAAGGWLPIDWTRLPAATLSLSSRRMGGPPGVGALVVRSGTRWTPLIEGGIEQDGRRAGRLHPALVAAFGVSAMAAGKHLQPRARRAAGLRDALADACRQSVDGIRIHTDTARALPGHLHVGIGGAEGEALLADLARSGICAESGSACVDGAGVPSSVLRACGFTRQEAASSILFRVTAGHTPETIRTVAGALSEAARRLRKMAP